MKKNLPSIVAIMLVHTLAFGQLGPQVSAFQVHPFLATEHIQAGSTLFVQQAMAIRTYTSRFPGALFPRWSIVRAALFVLAVQMIPAQSQPAPEPASPEAIRLFQSASAKFVQVQAPAPARIHSIPFKPDTNGFFHRGPTYPVTIAYFKKGESLNPGDRLVLHLFGPYNLLRDKPLSVVVLGTLRTLLQESVKMAEDGTLAINLDQPMTAVSLSIAILDKSLVTPETFKIRLSEIIYFPKSALAILATPAFRRAA